MTTRADSSARDTTSSAPDRRQAMLLMTAFAVLWAVLENEVGVRLRQPYDLTQIVWCRYASHLLIVAMVWGLRQPSRLWVTSRPRLQVGRSLLMLVMPLSFAVAVASGSAVAAAWAVFWCAPLLILAFANIVSHESVPAWAWLVTLLASVGAIAMIGPPGLPAVRALAWPLVMAGSFALYVVLTRELRSEPLSANMFFTAVGVIIPLSFYVPRVWMTPTPHDAIILLGIGAVGFLALVALDRAAERAPVSMTAAFLAMQVATTLLIAWVRQTVSISGLTFAGLAVTVMSLAALWRFVPGIRGTGSR